MILFSRERRHPMTEVGQQELRYSRLFTWGALAVVVVGAIVAFSGETLGGIFLVAAGLLIFLFVKRRTRRSGA
jgi:Flp pilus assembly protein TadB